MHDIPRSGKADRNDDVALLAAALGKISQLGMLLPATGLLFFTAVTPLT